MRPNLSASCCADASACPGLCPLAHADVAANSTSLAIIEQRAPRQGFWESGGFLLSVLQPKCAARLGLGVTPNAFVRDLDVGAFNALDGRRIEVIADGLTLWQGAQLAIDTTLVSPLRRDGSPRRGAARRAGVALEEARRRKETTYPQLVGEGGRARLVVLAAETGGRWSDETAHFLRSLAKAKAESVPVLLQNASEGRVVTEVEFDPGVQRREGFRSISPGQAPQPWRTSSEVLRCD